MKIYISSDIEGTCGICSWEETEHGSATADYFRKQMSREAAACAQGALDAGAEEVFVRDAHEADAGLARRSVLHDERIGPNI